MKMNYFGSPLIPLLSFVFLLLPCVHGTESIFTNASFSVTPLSFASVSHNLGFPTLKRDTFEMLVQRQIKQCEFPGGPICDSIHCCPPAYQCCSDGCCPVGSSCTGAEMCCAAGSTLCGDKSACCPSGEACCGGGCCSAGSVCERGECIDETLKDKIIRFDTLDTNRNVLKNMCNGLRGKNTETLTFRGRDKKERAATRKDAGCTPGYCSDQISKGLVPPNFNSCDEYPPASSLEGGNSRKDTIRAVNCIPKRENDHQGGKFGGMQSKLRALGIPYERGDKFVISVDCDKVLGDLVPRSRGIVPEDSERADKARVTEKRGSDVTLSIRDGEQVTMSGNETVDASLVGLLDDDKKHSYLAAPFGDLQPGTYSVKVQVLNGSTFGGFVLDNEGFNFTTNDTGLRAGQDQEYMFSLQYWTPGMGIFLGTTSNKTRIKWNLDGTLGQPAPNSSLDSPPVPTSTESGSGHQGSPNGATWGTFVSEKSILVTIVVITGFLILL